MSSTSVRAQGLAEVPVGPAWVQVHGLCKAFTSHLIGGTQRLVLHDVDLEVTPGSCVMLTGASGSGKSSLLRCIYRTYPPDSGDVVVGWPTAVGRRRTNLARADDRTVLAARRGIVGLATQFLSVTPRIAAVDLVAEAMDAQPAPANGDHPRRADAADLLRRVGLSASLIAAPPATFSGGERQMVNLAMALAWPRPLLLLDEVTASLDARRRRLALEVIAERKAAGSTLITVFHDSPDMPGLVDRVVRMEAGRVVPR